MKKSTFALPLAALALVPGASVANSNEADPLNYPQARRLDLVEEQFGVAVADPYRWLENDVRQDKEVHEWVNAENAVTQSYLATLPGREILQKRMAALFDHDRYGTPRKAGTRYFYTYNSGLQNQSPLFVREGLSGEQQLLLDPNGFSADGATALAEWEPSRDGSLLLYAVQDGGTDWRTLHVVDVEKGQVLPDAIRWVKFSGLAWDGEGKGFFYSRFDAPADGKTTSIKKSIIIAWAHRRTATGWFMQRPDTHKWDIMRKSAMTANGC